MSAVKEKNRRRVQALPARRRSSGYKPADEILEKLNADRENHLRELERLRATLLDLPEVSVEEADPAVAEQAQTRALIDRIEKHLEDVEEAIQAATRADYGVCERCGEPIDPERLKVLPETRLCVKCKRESEKFKTHHMW